MFVTINMKYYIIIIKHPCKVIFLLRAELRLQYNELRHLFKLVHVTNEKDNDALHQM